MPHQSFSTKIRVRFPPSPTGFLHIGSLRTALYNYLFAKKHGGEFILRIEDTDRARAVDGGVENIMRTLEWCGIEYDEGPFIENAKLQNPNYKIVERGDYGPYVQSARLEIYKKYADELLNSGKAYICTCSSERLAKLREEQTDGKMPTKYDGHCRVKGPKVLKVPDVSNVSYVIRLKVPEQGTTQFADMVHGEIRFENRLIDDQVLMKSDGYPTYHLANVVDDHLMKITHVIRGEEWLSSTPKHILLYNAFGWEPPEFAHLPLLLNADHSKLSKRQGDVAVEDYINKGYLPEALLNFVALLGFNPRADQELYTLDELISEFELTKVNKSGGVVNFEKLDWMNGEYIRKKSLEELTKLVIPYLPSLRDEDRLLVTKVVALEQERLKKLSDITEATAYFFVDQPDYKPEILVWKKMKKEAVTTNLKALHDALIVIYGGPTSDPTEDGPHQVAWDAPTLEREIKTWIIKEGRGVGEILWPMRVALSGRAASPPPFQIAEILGKEKTLKRLSHAIELAKQL